VKGICFFILGACQKPCEVDGTPAEVCKRSLARGVARKGLNQGWDGDFWAEEENKTSSLRARLGSAAGGHRTQRNTGRGPMKPARAVWHLKAQLGTHYW